MKTPPWPARKKNLAARKGGKTYNHWQARENINGDKRADAFISSSFQLEDF